MNLRLRLNVILTFVLVATVVVGMTYLVFDVRRAVRDEMHASVEMAAALIRVNLEHLPRREVEAAVARIGEQLASVGDTRHLSVTVAGDTASMSAPHEFMSPADVPRWFARLTYPEAPALARVVRFGDGQLSLYLQADPGDELSESWRELKPVIAMLVGFGLVANVLVYFVLGRSLAALQKIGEALGAIEAREFGENIPTIGVPDVDLIAERFNHMSMALMRSDEQTKVLAQRSLAIQENERRSFAQELHDEMGQSISAIKALAVSIQQRAAPSDDAIASNANTIVEVSSQIYDQVRRMMARLRPIALEELGLVWAVQEMVDDWNARHEETFCEFQSSGSITQLSDDVAINCFRIVQEALTNIAKHAKAQRAVVSLRDINDDDGLGRALEILITDDGCGYALPAQTRGLGLLGIEERAEAIGARLSVRSALGKGTSYEIVVPIRPQQSDVDVAVIAA